MPRQIALPMRTQRRVLSGGKASESISHKHTKTQSRDWLRRGFLPSCEKLGSFAAVMHLDRCRDFNHKRHDDEFGQNSGLSFGLLLDGCMLNEWDRRANQRWGADTMEIIRKVGKEGRAALTFMNAPHGFIYFSPHQTIALDHLEKFFSKHLEQTSK